MAVITLNKTNFKETIEKNPFVVVDFWAPWCEPCVAFSPTFESAAAKNSDIVFGMVNTETDPEIGDYFDVKQIPAILVIREQAGIHAPIIKYMGKLPLFLVSSFPGEEIQRFKSHNASMITGINAI